MQIYVPVLLLIGFVALNAVAIVVASSLITRARPTPVKQEAYESGMPPLGDARERFSVESVSFEKILIIFDIETVFMIPWGVAFQRLSCAVPLDAAGICANGQLSFFGFGEMLVFMLILVIG